MNRLQEDTATAHDNLIKPHKDKNRIKEKEANVKDVSLFMIYE